MESRQGERQQPRPGIHSNHMGSLPDAGCDNVPDASAFTPCDGMMVPCFLHSPDKALDPRPRRDLLTAYTMQRKCFPLSHSSDAQKTFIGIKQVIGEHDVLLVFPLMARRLY